MDAIYVAALAVAWAVTASVVMHAVGRWVRRRKPYVPPPEWEATRLGSQAVKLPSLNRRALPEVDRRRLVMIAGPHKSEAQQATDRWLGKQRLVGYDHQLHMVGKEEETRFEPWEWPTRGA